MKSRQNYVTRGISVVSLLLLYGLLSLVHGQQTVFNVPTTDVLDKGMEVGLNILGNVQPGAD